MSHERNKAAKCAPPVPRCLHYDGLVCVPCGFVCVLSGITSYEAWSRLWFAGGPV